MSSLSTSYSRLREALEAVGCKPAGSKSFDLGKNLSLRLAESSSLWVRLSSSAIHHRSFPGSVLAAGLAPRGPFKLIPAGPRGSVAIAADFPLCLNSRPGLQPFDVSSPVLEESADPTVVWAGALVRAVRKLAGVRSGDSSPGNQRRSGDAPAPSDLEDWLKRAGWSVSAAPAGFQVVFSGAGYFCTVLFRQEEQGVILDMELARASGWPAVSVRALGELAREANERLKLVRLVLLEEEDHLQLSAQVELGFELIKTPWTHLALDALRASAELLAREAPALEDPALAGLILKSSLRSSAK